MMYGSTNVITKPIHVLTLRKSPMYTTVYQLEVSVSPQKFPAGI